VGDGDYEEDRSGFAVILLVNLSIAATNKPYVKNAQEIVDQTRVLILVTQVMGLGGLQGVGFVQIAVQRNVLGNHALQ
jgi:hypothetical protein